MQPYKNLAFTTKFWGVLAYCLLVIGLQFHCTIIATNTPLRFSFSDILLIPFIFLFFYEYFFKKSSQVQFFLTDFNILLWFIVFSLWLGFSLWWGYYNSGVLQPWAFINKFLGWFVLVCYFFIGGFFSKNLSEVFSIILRTLFISSWMISGYFLIGALIINNFNYLLPRIEYNRFAGFLENPSAYGLFSGAILLLQLPFMQKKSLFNNNIHQLGVVLGFTSVIHSGSRTAIFALICSLIFLHTKMKFKSRQYIHCIIYTVFIMILLQINLCNIFNKMYGYVHKLPLQVVDHEAKDKMVKNSEPTTPKPIITKNYNYVFQSPMWLGQDYSGKKRLALTTDALRLWLKHPILGCGLGGFLHSQDVSYEKISKHEVFYTSVHPAMMNAPPTKNDAIILYDILSNCHVYIVKNGDWIRYENGTIRHIASYTNNFPKFPVGLSGLIKEHNPSSETRKFILEILSDSRVAPVSIHNTSIWLLTETGIIGLILFSIFVLYVIREIYSAANKDDEFIMGGTAVLILFILASLTTEVMYQRHLWFISGLMLASLKNKNLLYLAKNRVLGIGFSLLSNFRAIYK